MDQGLCGFKLNLNQFFGGKLIVDFCGWNMVELKLILYWIDRRPFEVPLWTFPFPCSDTCSISSVQNRRISPRAGPRQKFSLWKLLHHNPKLIFIRFFVNFPQREQNQNLHSTQKDSLTKHKKFFNNNICRHINFH